MMHRSRLKTVCLVWLLLLAVLLPVLTEAKAQGNTEGQEISQIILVPYASNNDNYSNADPDREILEVLTGLFHLLSDDTQVEVKLINQGVTSAVNPQVLNSSMINMRRDRNQIQKTIEALDGALAGREMEKTAILVLDCSGQYENDWTGKLTGYADKGALTAFIEVQNPNNAKKLTNYATPLGISPEPAANQVAVSKSHPQLSFAWINNPDAALSVLFPFFNMVMGNRYTRVEAVGGAVTLNPYATLTAFTDIIVQGALKAGDIQAGAASAAPVYQNGFFSHLRVGSGTDNIQVNSVSEIYTAQTYINTEGITFQLGSTSSKTTFEYQETNELYAWLDGSALNPVLLAQDLSSHGLQPVLVDQDNRKSAMVWDANNQRWIGSVALDHSGDWKLQMVVPDAEGKTLFRSNSYSCTVTITEPDIRLETGWPQGTEEDPVVLWTHDPWQPETGAHVEIPVQSAGKLIVAANPDMNQKFVPDVGDLRVNEDNNKIEIILNNYQPSETKSFVIYLVSDIGEISSRPRAVHVTLLNLSDSIGRIKLQAAPINQAVMDKNQPVTVSVVVDDSKCEPGTFEKVRNRLRLSAAVIDSEDREIIPSVDMTEGESRQYSVQLQHKQSGAYTALLTAEWIGTEGTEGLDSVFWREKLPFSLAGSRPEKITENIPDQDGELPLGGENAYWETEKYKIPELFGDADKDPLTVSFSVAKDGKPAGLQISDGGTISLLEDGPEELKLANLQEFSFRMTDEGTYQVSVYAMDEDGESEPYQFVITGKTLITKIINFLKKYGIFIAAGVILLIAVLIILKPSFKNKVVDVTVSNEQWNQSASVDLSAWGKSRKPFYQLLTCCACPPDPEIYQDFSETMVRPSRRGIKLKGVVRQTGQKTAKVDEKHTFTCSSGSYRIKITARKLS